MGEDGDSGGDGKGDGDSDSDSDVYICRGKAARLLQISVTFGGSTLSPRRMGSMSCRGLGRNELDNAEVENSDAVQTHTKAREMGMGIDMGIHEIIPCAHKL